MVDGYLTTLPEWNARENVAALRAGEPGLSRRAIEEWLNHDHASPALCASREGLRRALELAAELASELREACPEQQLVVTCWLGEDRVSFYQADEETPRQAAWMDELIPAVSPTAGDPRLRWCDACGRGRDYRVTAEPDPEFPMVEWGECLECGAEMVVSSRKFCVRVGPGWEPWPSGGPHSLPSTLYPLPPCRL